MKNIQIFDTTLRDWAQTAWVNMSSKVKIDIAEQIDEFWVDMIEAWFAASSEWDKEAIRIISERVTAKVFSLARLKKSDIDISYEALENSNNRWIHTFIWTSPMHRDYKLKMSQYEILEQINEKVWYAKQIFNKDLDSIMFSPEDALRTEEEFLFDSIDVAILAWANQINIPDTVWFAQNIEIYELTKKIIEKFWHRADFSIHTHNDLWQAVSNSLNFIKAWWSIVQWTFPPAYWERAWNADLIQVLMNIIKRPGYFWVEINWKIDMTKAYKLASYIWNKIWKRIPDNYPVLWRDVYNHSSWIHQDWANKNKSTYEIIQPEEIWYKIEHSFILTNQSWRAWLENAISSYFWIILDKEKLNLVFTKFKNIISSNPDSIVITMDDIRMILLDSWIDTKRNISVNNYFINLDIDNDAKASIEIEIKWVKHYSITSWNWPVDAIYKAILKASDYTNINLVDFSINALSSNPSSPAKVSIIIEHNWKIYEEFWLDTDIVKASIQAFINCLDRIHD